MVICQGTQRPKKIESRYFFLDESGSLRKDNKGERDAGDQVCIDHHVLHRHTHRVLRPVRLRSAWQQKEKAAGLQTQSCQS